MRFKGKKREKAKKSIRIHRSQTRTSRFEVQLPKHWKQSMKSDIKVTGKK